MDNLTRKREDLKFCKIDYLQALKRQLEADGEKILKSLDQMREDN
jgi:hypothetical protein